MYAQKHQNAEYSALLYYIEAQDKQHQTSGRNSGNTKKLFSQQPSHFTIHNPSISGNKIHFCRYFLQHYYRDWRHLRWGIVLYKLL